MKTSDILTLQIFFHLVGDYLTQSDWMADNKTKRSWPALWHATVYSLPFCLIAPDGTARAVIFITHFFIDRFRLAVFVCYAKNQVFGPHLWHWVAYRLFGWESRWRAAVVRQQGAQPPFFDKWANCNVTGYPSQKPFALTIWLLIIADNILHLTINYLSIRFL